MSFTRRLPTDIVFDRPRALEVLTKLYEAYREEKQLYTGVRAHSHAPQRMHIPDNTKIGSLEHRRWLFFATMTDRREGSERVYESHVRIHRNHPWLYTEEIVGSTKDDVENILRRYKVGSPGQSAGYWPRSGTTLFQEFGGDPLSLYRDKSIDSILSFKKKKGNILDPLPGFGPKILSLLSIFLTEVDVLRPIPDAFPVDIHVQRFAISTGILQSKGKLKNEDAESVLRHHLCAIVAERGWSTLDLSHAIWFLGNRLCTACHAESGVKVLCPAYAFCGGAIPSSTYFKKGYWDLDVPRYRKGGQLPLVPLEKHSLFSGVPFDPNVR